MPAVQRLQTNGGLVLYKVSFTMSGFIALGTKQVISVMFFLANLLA